MSRYVEGAGGSSTLDMLLVFPPQWSPFQPCLALPSLAAWLKRAGFTVRCLDLNLLFYEWLLSDDCAHLLLEQLDRTRWPRALRHAYRMVFESAAEFRRDQRRLKDLCRNSEEVETAHYVRAHYIAIKSVETYLDAISLVARRFAISPYRFQLRGNMSRADHLEHSVAVPPSLLTAFVQQAIAEHIQPQQPRTIGVSCIGQEQLYFTLLLGASIKAAMPVPVVVGGTILPRLHERAVLPDSWFGQYFDVIVRNEGEKPAEQLLNNLHADRPLTDNVSNIVIRQDEQIVATAP